MKLHLVQVQVYFGDIVRHTATDNIKGAEFKKGKMAARTMFTSEHHQQSNRWPGTQFYVFEFVKDVERLLHRTALKCGSSAPHCRCSEKLLLEVLL